MSPTDNNTTSDSATTPHKPLQLGPAKYTTNNHTPIPNRHPKNPQACLLGLPNELKSMILDHLLPRSTINDKWPLFLLRHKVYDMRGSQKAIANPPTKLTSILRTSHSAYNLAATSLYVLSHVRIDFTIDDQKPEPPERGIPVGSVSQLKFWPYLRSVQLDITLRTDGDETLVLERIRQVIEALERGKHLRRLWIDLDWEDGKPIPGSFDAVVEALGALEMSHARGGVSITVKGDMEDEEKERIEERVTAKLEDRPEERLERRERDWQGLEKA